MYNSIYVSNDNVVNEYEVSFDKEEFERIIDEIDLWYGRGEMKAYIGDTCPDMPGKKTSIFAVVDLLNNKKEFFYYQYIQHPLARTANAMLKNNDIFESSKLIRLLSTWTCESETEQNFVIRLMSCFQFNKVPLGDAMVIDLTEEDKRGFFKRVIDAVKKKERRREFLVGNTEFHETLDSYVDSMITDNNRVYGEDLANFMCDGDQKRFNKRRIWKSLPSREDINK